MADRLRELIDLVLDSLDEPGTDGRALAQRAHFSRDHLDRVRELLAAAATLPPAALEQPLRPGFVAVWFEGEEASAAIMAERLVYTLEVWAAAIAGQPAPPPAPPGPDLAVRFERAARAFTRLVRRIRDRDAWDDVFIDALCEPPETFTFGGVVSHVLS